MRSRPIRTLAIASLLAGLSATAGNVVLGQQTATLVITVIDSAARNVQTLAKRREVAGAHPSLDRILEIRSAAKDMLGLYE